MKQMSIQALLWKAGAFVASVHQPRVCGLTGDSSAP